MQMSAKENCGVIVEANMAPELIPNMRGSVRRRSILGPLTNALNVLKKRERLSPVKNNSPKRRRTVTSDTKSTQQVPSSSQFGNALEDPFAFKDMNDNIEDYDNHEFSEYVSILQSKELKVTVSQELEAIFENKWHDNEEDSNSSISDPTDDDFQFDHALLCDEADDAVDLKRQRVYSITTPELFPWVDKDDLPDCKAPQLAALLHYGYVKGNNREKQMMPNMLYFQRHPDLTTRMRTTMIGWLMEVAKEFILHRETVYLAVNFIDRYLSLTTNVPRNKLQLLGITALFVASKLEEMFPPKLKYYVLVCDDAFTRHEIVDMELKLMQTLKWDLCNPTCNLWLNLYLQNASRWFPKHFAPNNQSMSLSIFQNFRKRITPTRKGPGYLYKTSHYLAAISLLDIAIHDLESTIHCPSLMAASAFYLKCCQFLPSNVSFIAGKDPSEIIKACTGYSIDQIQFCNEWLSLFDHIPLDIEVSTRMYTTIDESDQHNIQAYNKAIVPSLRELFSL
ncbi:Cyclin domain-containing protein [Rozella allomycis CSF55]|uniref:Cyclin domain-containing protein n=1 Tax=Rozella allomycis (strain CSF55) TaxID=988480 RepID=A0A075AVS8_ROZAC|nr:Cyclin domain-containing protein [Rozella allomycis CSF55]|eukprot:EPZ34375.1 Cyclin domain-containing protein [Rozella allomycis CSF55]